MKRSKHGKSKSNLDKLNKTIDEPIQVLKMSGIPGKTDEFLPARSRKNGKKESKIAEKHIESMTFK